LVKKTFIKSRLALFAMKVHIHTFGCSLNQSDSELIEGLLVLGGYEIVAYAAADLVIFNTCTVKDSPEKSFYSILERTVALGKKVIVAGCVSQADPLNSKLKSVSIIGVRHLEMICEVAEETMRGKAVKLLNFKKNARLNLPKIRKNPVVEILPISSGCLGDCTFCKTRFARGVLYSYDPLEIKKQLETAVSEGVKEVWLTSQDAGAFGRDIGSDLTILLDELVKVPGDYKIRLGMINPDLAKDMIPGLARFLNHPRAFKFIHLPVQSGSDRVLNSMGRRYLRGHVVELVGKLRSLVPGVTVATDIITGFPTETEQEHKETADLMREIKFSVVNLTKFYSRAGTKAAAMKLHPTKLVKMRCVELAELQKGLVDNAEWLGWRGRIVIDEFGKNGTCVGRNEFYKPIVVKGKFALGDSLLVRIVKVNQYYFSAEIE